MTATASTSRRSSAVRRIALLGAATATAVVGGVGIAGASSAAPAGYTTQIGCTTVSGSISYQPGLINGAARNVNATLHATLSGCSDFVGNSFADKGALNAQLSGKTTAKGEVLSGSFVITWPTSSHYNPTVGTITLRKSDTSYSLQGATSSTTGAWEGSYVSTSYFVTSHKGQSTKAHPLVSQSFVNTVPLTVSHNSG